MQPDLLKAIKETLDKNPSVVFAYFYGSSKDSEVYSDIDIAVFSTRYSDPFSLSVDLKIALSERTGINPDSFDVRVINHLLKKGDLFSLLYLKDVLSQGNLLLDKNFSLRASFVEAFSMKYRECEGLITEVCT